MKDIDITYHTTTVDGNQLALTVEDDHEVEVLDARTIAGTETRWQFLIKSERAPKGQGNGR